jgi:hypothetical protein
LEYLSGLAPFVPVPKSVADYGSRKARAKMQERMEEQPVLEGVKEAFRGRGEALTRVPQDPRKARNLAPWMEYYFLEGGSEDLEQFVDLATSKMSKEEGERFKKAFRKLEFDKQMKAAAAAGAGIAVGQALGAIPHPVARGLKIAWQVSGAVAASNKLGDVSDKLQELEEASAPGYKLLEEHVDHRVKKGRIERRERHQKIQEKVSEQLFNPFA